MVGFVVLTCAPPRTCKCHELEDIMQHYSFLPNSGTVWNKSTGQKNKEILISVQGQIKIQGGKRTNSNKCTGPGYRLGFHKMSSLLILFLGLHVYYIM